MEALLHDLRIGARGLLKARSYTAIVTLTLALAIGVNTVVFSFVNFFVLRPMPFKDVDRLTMMSGTHPDRGHDRVPVSYADYLEWRGAKRSFEELAAFGRRSFNLTGVGEPLHVQGQLASATLFPVWGLGTSIGRPLVAEDDRRGAERVVLLSHGFWTRRFGADRGVLGRSVTLDGRPHVVVGVVTPEIEIGNLSEIDVWVPLALEADPVDRSARFLRVSGKLRQTADLRAAQAELRAIAERQQREHPDTHAGWSVRVQTLRSAISSASAWVVLALLSVTVSLVLAIACANVANLMLARGTARLRETAVRAALGATRGRLVRQLLTEGAMLSALGGALGLLLAGWGLHLIRSVTYEQFFQLVVIDRRVLAFSVATSLLSPLLFGLLPALQAARIDLVAAIQQGGARTVGERAAGPSRSGLVVLQVSLAAALLIVAGLTLRSAFALQTLDPGYDVKDLLSFRIALPEAEYGRDEQVRPLVASLLERLAAAPGARAVASGTEVPGLEANTLVPLAVEGVEADGQAQSPSAVRTVAGAGYFEALGIPLLAGRGVRESDGPGGVPVVVVSRALVRRYLGGREPIGARIRLGPANEPWREVVGVAEDVLNNDQLNQPPLPHAHVPFAQSPVRRFVVFVRTGDPEPVLRLARAEIARRDPALAIYQERTVERTIFEETASNRVITGLFTTFGAVALCLATIGLFGVVSYSVAQRTREFGLRMALGATAADVLRMVLGQGTRLMALGLFLGLLVGAALSRAISGALYGVSAHDPLTFGAVPLLLLLAALPATLLPALRALCGDPMASLRSE
jgi:predicted permease